MPFRQDEQITVRDSPGGEAAAQTRPRRPSSHPIPQIDLAPATVRPRARGKFLFIGHDKLYIRGVTYGAFRPDENGKEYHDLALVDRDFAQMAAHGINAVRIPHTTPPRQLLDIAQRHGLWVMVGLSAEQYVGYLIEARRDAPDVEALIRARVRSCAGHPALLCYALGNEIPAPLARWLGRRAVERYLERLCRAVKDEDPGGLVGYVNYPTTEYLQLPFLDLLCFNVYLESQERLEAYLARLQNIGGDRPLIMSELGLDSLRHGQPAQAQSLDWQVRTAFASGCAGAFVFSWTDEWHRNSHDVEDWAFGLTCADRTPKPSLAAVRDAFAQVPFASAGPWPRISVVVCTYNGARTIRDCCEGLRRLDYPNYEVIVVDDGSVDDTAAIASEYDVRLIRTGNQGLSSARNTGLTAATGELIAYLDDDAYPDPHWLTYLAATFRTTTHAGVGGPNLAPPGDGPIADCIAQAPGGPVHVLVTDRVAEHIPGCNMTFRRAALEAIGGFDARFRTAGDDVDVCWRLQERGWTLGFHPAAVVWHHRRNSVRAFWKQQVGYGRAEAMLERKWPEKYNGAGHVRWTGRMYGGGLPYLLGLRRARVYHGVWGLASYQSLYQPPATLVSSLPQMPEWHLVTVALASLTALGAIWSPLRIAGLLFVAAIVPPVAQAILGGGRARFPETSGSLSRFKRRVLTTLLHFLQPVARLRGRIQEGLTPWRQRCPWRPGPLWPVTTTVSSDHWANQDQRLWVLEATLRAGGICVARGERHTRWDLEVRAGSLGAARLLMGVEELPCEHPMQLIRMRWWPKVRIVGPLLFIVFATLALEAFGDQAWLAAGVLGSSAMFTAIGTVLECTSASAMLREAVRGMQRADT